MSIREELLSIKGDRELLLVEDVLEWAQAHPDSDLHGAIEWNQRKAAREYQLWQCRRLMAIHITFEDGQRKLVSLSVDRSRNGGGYRDVSDVIRDKGLYEIMLADALAELARVEARYERVKALRPVWSAVRKVRDQRRKKKGGEGPAARAG